MLDTCLKASIKCARSLVAMGVIRIIDNDTLIRRYRLSFKT